MNRTTFGILLLGLALLGISVIAYIGATAAERPQESPILEYISTSTTLTSEGPMSTLQSELGNIATQTAAAGGGVAETATATPEPTEAPTEVEPTEKPTKVSTATPTPKATPTRVPQITQPPLIGTHIVKPGETLYCLGRAYGVQPWSIADVNGLARDAKLSIGQVLEIPNEPWSRVPPGKICTPQFKSPYSSVPVITDDSLSDLHLGSQVIQFVSFEDEPMSHAANARLSLVDASPTPTTIAEVRKVIVEELPKKMSLGQSSQVVLTFNPETGRPHVEVTASPGQTPQPTLSIPYSQPLDIPDVFSDYLVFAVARLDAAGFSVSPVSDIKYPVVVGEGITWRWSIKPLDAEHQTLILSLRLSFEPIEPDITHPLSEMPLWSDSFDVDVGATLFGLTTTQQKTGSLFGALIGFIPTAYAAWGIVGAMLTKKETEQPDS